MRIERCWIPPSGNRVGFQSGLVTVDKDLRQENSSRYQRSNLAIKATSQIVIAFMRFRHQNVLKYDAKFSDVVGNFKQTDVPSQFEGSKPGWKAALISLWCVSNKTTEEKFETWCPVWGGLKCQMSKIQGIKDANFPYASCSGRATPPYDAKTDGTAPKGRPG